MCDKKVYVCDCGLETQHHFDFRTSEYAEDYQAIMNFAQKTNNVYTLEEFQDLCNDEEIDLSNSFILIH